MRNDAGPLRLCRWSRHSLVVLTATCGTKLDRGVLAVGHGTVSLFASFSRA